ncbi:MAG: hypothetical protein ABJD07_14215 [Gemmatimonadaceae bacterium]
MWGDTFLLFERAHLLRLLAWGGLSLIAGTTVLVVLAIRGARPPLVTHFAIQTAAWGAIIIALGALAWHQLAERDLNGLMSLSNRMWLNVGLDAGYIALGFTLAIAGRVLDKRWAVVGAGIAVALQGLALLALHLRFLEIISRSVR